ncbi:MAG TPA: DUF5658 family protein [Pyrinomonadaceae bacterium]|nr:DUF5658 family protein [Pyrinomonadaceae bacterium]
MQFKGTVEQFCTRTNIVNLSRPIFWLLFLNVVDAFVTLIWVRSGIAPESNQLMAALLDVGDFPFLLAKLAMGVVTAVVLYYGSEYRLARIGVTVALGAYVCTLGIHVFTGLAAFGYLS